MIPNIMDYSEVLYFFRPFIALGIGAFLILGVDIVFGKKHSLASRQSVATLIGSWAIVLAALGVTINLKIDSLLLGMVHLDGLAVLCAFGILILAFLTMGIIGGGKPRENSPEMVAIILMATCGLMIMASANELLLAFLALELASLSLYILVGFEKRCRASAEAGLKYLLTGSVASAFLLLGFGILYGFTKTLNISEIAVIINSKYANDPLLIVALVMIFVTFGFKVAAVPFHLWAPDVYQGAPTPAASFVSSASKVAGVAFFARILWPNLPPMATPGLAFETWMPVVVTLAIASLLLGNIAALAQKNVRRLLAYSAISHAGIMCISMLCVGTYGVSQLFYYALTYAVAAIGAFGVLAIVERSSPAQSLNDLNGLYQRSPFLAISLGIYVLSLAGIPPLGGFFAKFYVFLCAFAMEGTQYLFLAIFGLLMSVVSLYYYLKILKHAFVLKSANTEPIKLSMPGTISLIICILILVTACLYQSPLANTPF